MWRFQRGCERTAANNVRLRVQCGWEYTANVCSYVQSRSKRTPDVCIRELEAEAPKRCLCVRAPVLLIREFDDEADGSIRIAWGYGSIAGSIAGVAFVVHVPLIII